MLFFPFSPDAFKNLFKQFSVSLTLRAEGAAAFRSFEILQVFLCLLREKEGEVGGVGVASLGVASFVTAVRFEIF